MDKLEDYQKAMANLKNRGAEGITRRYAVDGYKKSLLAHRQRPELGLAYIGPKWGEGYDNRGWYQS